MGWWSSNWFQHPYTLFRRNLKESLSPFMTSPSRFGWRSVFFSGQPGLVYISPPVRAPFWAPEGCCFSAPQTSYPCFGGVAIGETLTTLDSARYKKNMDPKMCSPKSGWEENSSANLSLPVPKHSMGMLYLHTYIYHQKSTRYSCRYLEPKWPGLFWSKMTKSSFWGCLNPQNSRVPKMGRRFSCTIWGVS